eukprot:TRINITY_DN7865_c0_g1_i14.p1 TRINITY_DN7865_c0_g1~~TRINITY_DN7865_c0_g1_i14.p1  ORF type:complete len:117 (+),score=0.26 TRINITY_DN7865_c0_g1_i14:529-879(+)
MQEDLHRLQTHNNSAMKGQARIINNSKFQHLFSSQLTCLPQSFYCLFHHFFFNIYRLKAYSSPSLKPFAIYVLCSRQLHKIYLSISIYSWQNPLELLQNSDYFHLCSLFRLTSFPW